MTEIQLKRIINEEISGILNEGVQDDVDKAVENAIEWAEAMRNEKSVSSAPVYGDNDWNDAYDEFPYGVMLFYYNISTGLMFQTAGQPYSMGCTPLFIFCYDEREAIKLADKYTQNNSTTAIPKPSQMRNPDDYVVVAAITCKFERRRDGNAIIEWDYGENDYKLRIAKLEQTGNVIPYDVQCSDGSVLKTGSSYNVDEFYKWSDGSITYKISSGKRKAVILYDNKQAALADGWVV